MPLIIAAAVKNGLFNIIMNTNKLVAGRPTNHPGIPRYQAANITQLMSAMGQKLSLR